MTLRDQIEAVLKKHGVTYVNPRNTYIEPVEAQMNMKQFIDDLLTCVPQPSIQSLNFPPLTCTHVQPSREELEKILDREEEPFCNFPQHPNTCKCFLDTLLAWATGTGKTAWCRHQDAAEMPNPHEWSFCPICSAPRPQATRHE